MNDSHDPQTTEDDEAKSIEISRRLFLQASAAVPLSASVARAQGGDPTEADEVELDFQFIEGRRKIQITALFPSPQGEDFPPVATDNPIQWTIDARRFGPSAYFTFRDTTNAVPRNRSLKRYELRVRDVQYGVLPKSDIVFYFEQRDMSRNGPKRFGVIVETNFVQRDGRLPFFLEDFTNPMEVSDNEAFVARLGSKLRRRRPYPALFRAVARDDDPVELRQQVNANTLPETFDGMFNALIRYNDRSGRRRIVDVVIKASGVWEVRSTGTGLSNEISIASVLLPLKTIRFGWMSEEEGMTGKAPHSDTGEAYQLFGRAVRANMEEFDLDGGDGPNAYLKQTSASERDDPTDPGTFVLRRDDARADGASRAEATLPGLFTLTIGDRDDEEQLAGPFKNLAARLLLRADRATPRSTVEFSLSFDGDFASTKAQRITSPIGPLVLRGPTLSPAAEFDGEGNEVPARRPRVFLDPFSPRWDQGVSLIWSNARTSNRDLEWAEINVLLLEHAAGLAGAEYSRLTFEPSDLRILWAPSDFTDPASSTESLLRLGPPGLTPGTRIDLSRATLRASRSHDLLSLGFRFSGLSLAYGAEGAPRLVKGLAACALPPANGVEDWGTLALIAVDFPGQHLFEEALFLPKPEPLPDVRLEPARARIDRATGGITQDEAEPPAVLTMTEAALEMDLNDPVQVDEGLRLLDKSRGSAMPRRAFREALNALKTNAGDSEFTRFETAYRSAFQKLQIRLRLPESQREFIGNVGLDVDTRALANSVQRRLNKERAEEFYDGFVSRLKEARDAIFDAAAASQQTVEETAIANSKGQSVADALVLEGRLEQAVPVYQLLRSYYRDRMLDQSILGGGEPEAPEVTETTALNLELFSAIVVGARDELPAALNRDVAAARFNAVRDEFTKNIIGQDEQAQINGQTGAGLVEGRLANPSRLVFRVFCRDWIEVQRAGSVTHLDQPDETQARLPRDTLEFSLEALTNFADFELAVTKRAERLYTADEAGRTDRLSRRTLNVSPGAMLDHLGFHEGPFVNSATRLGDVQKALQTPPGAFETAIEIPARLILSPHQDAVVVGRGTGTVPNGVYADDSRAPTPGRPVWSADFLIEAQDPGLRAVASPDLQADFLWGGQYGTSALPGVTPSHVPAVPPPRGPIAPWLSGQGMGPIGARQPILIGAGRQDFERSRGVPDDPSNEWSYVVHPSQKRAAKPSFVEACKRLLGSQPDKPVEESTRFRGATDAFTRHELVLLSSGWGLPVLGRRLPTGGLTQGSSQVEPEPRHRLIDLEAGSALYEPRPLEVTELSLGTLGGSLRHDSSFEPPAAALRKGIGSDASPALFDALSIERWQQWTVLGRDVFCEVTFKGFLFPLGHRAALVKVTEREFLRHCASGSIRAYLRQRMFIRLGKPEKRFPAISQPFEGRLFPVERLRILTTQTPDIMDPSTNTSRGEPKTGQILPVNIDAFGRLDLRKRSALAFWPRTAPLQEANVRFEMEVDGAKTDIPLIFVDNVAANDPDSLREIVATYNNTASPDDDTRQRGIEPLKHLRTMLFRGEKRRYAPEKKAGSASLETDHWTLAASGRVAGGAEPASVVVPNVQQISAFTPILDRFTSTAILQGADQPPFYPQVDVARIRLRQAERLVGRPYPPVRARYDFTYLQQGFPEVPEGEVIAGNAGEVFLALVSEDQEEQSMGKKGDQSGGVFRPSGRMVALSRVKGVLSNETRVSVPLGAKRIAPDAEKPDETRPVVGAYVRMASLFDHDATPPAPRKLSQAEMVGKPAEEKAALVKANAALDRAREIYKKLFDSKAKILGLVSLKDLMDVLENLENPNTGSPELDEQIRYGAGQLKNEIQSVQGQVTDVVNRVADEVDELTGEVRQQADDAVDLVRIQVVKPLSDAVNDIRKGWDEIEAQLAKEQRIIAPSQISAITIREIFPELDAGLTALSVALTDSANEGDQIAFALSLGAVYEAGRRFIDALQRSLSNPVARIEDAFRSRFDALRDIFDGVVGNLEAVAKRFVGDALAIGGRELAKVLADTILPNQGPNKFTLPLIRLPELEVLTEVGLDPLLVQGLVDDLRAVLFLERSEARWLLENFFTFSLDPDVLISLDEGDPLRDLVRRFLRDDRFAALLTSSNANTIGSTFLGRRPHGEQLARWLEGRQDDASDAIQRVIDAVEQRIDEIEAEIDAAVDDAIVQFEAERARLEALAAEYRVLLGNYAEEAIDEVIERIVDEFYDEIAVLADVIVKTDALVAAVQDAEPRPIIDSSVALLEVFVGPIDITSESLCEQANRFVEPLKRVLTYLNPEELLLSDPRVLQTQVQLVEQRLAADLILTLPDEESTPVPTGDKPGTRIFEAHREIAAALKEGTEGFFDAQRDLEDAKDDAPDLAEDIDAVIDQLDALVLPTLREVNVVHTALSVTYRDLIKADRGATVLRGRLNALTGIDICGPDIAVQLDAAARFPQDLEAFARNYETLAGTLLGAGERIGAALEGLLKSDAAYVALGGLLVAELDSQTGIFAKISAVAEDAGKLAEQYAKKLQQLEYRLAFHTARLLRDILRPIQAQAVHARALVDFVQGWSEEELVKDLLVVDGLDENLKVIEGVVNYLDDLNARLEELATEGEKNGTTETLPAREGPTLTDLQDALGEGPGPLDFMTVSVSGNEQSKTLAELRQLRSEIEAEIQTIVVALRAKLRRAETAILERFDGVVAKTLGPLGQTGFSVVGFYEDAVRDRTDLVSATPEFLRPVLQEAIVAKPGAHHRRYPPTPSVAIYEPPEADAALTLENDALSGDAVWLRVLASGQPLSDPVQREFLGTFLKQWATVEEATPAVIGASVVDVISDILRGDIMRLIDLNSIRTQIEDYLLSLVPAEIQMRYGYGVELGEPVRKATAGIFAPGKGSRLDVNTGIVIRLNQFEPEIAFSSVGTLGAFDVKLVGDAFDALTLKFKGARFETKGGSKPRFDITYDDYVIGKELEFVQELQSILSPSEGSGAFILPRFGLPGIEAGYSMNLGVFSIGTASFFNIALRTSAILPFGDGDARFRAALSSRTDPFTISYLPFGGSGFFAIEANTDGIVGFEASFEFGGAAAFGFGPLTGQGRLMSGVYVRQITLARGRKLTEISGTFYVGGSARIWIFGFGASLYVRLGMINGDMSGEAVFTYSFSIGIKDFDFSVQVWKQEEKGFNGQTASLGPAGPTRFAQAGGGIGSPRTGPLVETGVTLHPNRNYAGYRDTYFRKPLRSEDFF